MPIFQQGATRIHYEVRGDGFPVLALAPGGLRSNIELWTGRPIDPLVDLSPHFQVIAMDQRNAGESWAPITAEDGWQTYTEDQLGLLEHLGVTRFAAVGMCIGGSFVSGLAQAVPDRLAAAVMLQPIGLENNREVFMALARSWQAAVAEQHPEATDATFEALAHRLFAGDFQFNVTEEFAKQFPSPLLVLMGDDVYHPQSVSRRLAAHAPRGELITDWKSGQAQDAAKARTIAFIQEHAATLGP